MHSSAFLSALARSILAGEAALDPIVTRMSETLGQNWRWIRPLARRYLRAFSSQDRPRRRDVIRFLDLDQSLRDAKAKYRDAIRVVRWLPESEPIRMRPVSSASNWNVPAIGSIGALAQWLQLTPGELEWLADLNRLTTRFPSPSQSRLGHYHYRLLVKSSGALRLIESPKQHLKQLQRQILAGILEQIPLHAAAHGFVKHRSIKSFAASHAGRALVARMDLHDFFPSIRRDRVQGLFRTAGYPESVADLLGGICTHPAPRGIWKSLAGGVSPETMAEARALYAWPHLPQGAPTSPAIANICMYRVDSRLDGLAKSTGGTYTRYADDLAFSGDAHFARSVERLLAQAAAILAEEGFAVHHRKTRIMRQSVRQQLAGLVVNQQPNIMRGDFDRLKATLTNCIRHGPETQNRDAHPAFRLHLEGKIAFVEMINPARGARLRRIYERIDW